MSGGTAVRWCRCQVAQLLGGADVRWRKCQVAQMSDDPGIR